MKSFQKKKRSLQGVSTEFLHYPVVVLLGRVNVGKSTLFNTLIEQKKAVVSPAPGTTRDINYGLCQWRGGSFIIVDTGGYTGEKGGTEIERKTSEQALRFIDAADLLVMVCDGREGLNPDDKTFLRRIRQKSDTPILLAVNKSEKHDPRDHNEWSEWLKLGLGNPFRISAVSGQGTGDLLDGIAEHLSSISKKELAASEADEIRIAIVGRTNVGKSSLLNAILGEERVIVSPIAHTTREPQDTVLMHGDIRMRIIDTVGMRRKSKIASKIDAEGFARSMKAIDTADVMVLVLESTVTPSKQESRLAGIAKDAGVGMVIVVNKWDLIEDKTTKTAQTFQQLFAKYFASIPWAPMMFVSAIQRQRVKKILDMVVTVAQERGKTVPQDDLDALLKSAMTRQPPQWIRGQKKPIIYSIAQEKIDPPSFLLVVNNPLALSYAYLRYLEHRIRDMFGFQGTPIRLYTEEKRKLKSEVVKK